MKPLAEHYIVRPLALPGSDFTSDRWTASADYISSRIARRLRTICRRCCGLPASAPIRASVAKFAARPSGWSAQFKQLGLATELIETAGHPLVYAESPPVPGEPVALVYGHYDVQPPEPLDEWISPPFEPTVRDGNVYARGATDDKGQMLTHVKSVEAWIKSGGKLPMQVKFLIEGEEEVGSEHLAPFVAANREEAGLRLRRDQRLQPVRARHAGDHVRPARHRVLRAATAAARGRICTRARSAGRSRTRPTRW